MHPDFKKDGYLVCRNFLDDTTVALMQTYFDFKYRIINFSPENRSNSFKSVQANLKEPNKPGDVGSSFLFYGDHLTESIHLNYGQLVCDMLRAKLSPTYTYSRIYEKGDSLLAHTDRPSCEISATCPITVSGDGPSTIFISNYTADYNNPRYDVVEIEKRGDYTEVNLFPGDVLFYKGCERYHWRRPLEEDYLIQFFMHFIETDGVNKDWVFDKRPYSGFPESYKRI